MNCEEVLAALSAGLDGEANAGELAEARRHLASCGSCRAEAAYLRNLNALLAAARRERRAWCGGSPWKRARHWTAAMALSAAAALLFAAGLCLERPWRDGLRLAAFSGNVILGDRPARAGQRVRKGMMVRVGAAGSAVLRYGDGTQLTIAEQSDLACAGPHGRARRFRLVAGSVLGKVTPDSGGLEIATDLGHVRVPGTVFELSVSPILSGSAADTPRTLRLAVAQGRAELALAAGPACCQVVPAGEAVRAIEGQPRISSAAPLLAAEWQRLLGTIPGFTDPKLPAADVPAGVWVPRWPGRNGPTPGSRTRVRMVYSAELGGGVLFGGQGGDNALWCYEARADRWKRVADAHELRKAADAGLFPEPRHGHVLAALPGWGLLLTGGNARLDPGLVWRLRPGSTSWMRAADDRKCWALYAANCASPGAGKVYVFGAEGNLPESGFAAFDVRAGQWQALRPSPMPVKRTGMDNCMCWDSKRERILMLRCPARNDPADTPVQTWSYVPGSNLWVDLKPAVLPGNRDHGAMDYSPRADAVLLYGGGGANSETWSFHCGSNRWERLDPANNPPPRSGHALYYDPAADLFATYGGEGPGGARDDIWTFRLAPNR